MNRAGLQRRHQIQALMSIELPLIKGEKSMGLVPSMVLRSQSPVDNWEDWLVVEANRAKYAAAYSVSPQVRVILKRKWALYAFSTFLNKNSIPFNRIHYKPESPF